MTDLIFDIIVLLSVGVYFVTTYMINKRTETLLRHLIVVVAYHSRLLEKTEPNYGKTDGVDND